MHSNVLADVTTSRIFIGWAYPLSMQPHGKRTSLDASYCMAYACRFLHIIKREHLPENEKPLLTEIIDISHVRPPCFRHEVFSSTAYLSVNTIFAVSNSIAPQYWISSSKTRTQWRSLPLTLWQLPIFSSVNVSTATQLNGTYAEPPSTLMHPQHTSMSPG